MTSAGYIKVKLFETALRESNGKAGIYGQIIARCLANRVRRNMGTWLEVLANVPKYRANEPDPGPDYPDLWQPQIQMLLQGIDDVYDNRGVDTANGGLYWCFTEKGMSESFRESIVKSGAVTAIQNSLKVWGEPMVIGKPSWEVLAGVR